MNVSFKKTEGENCVGLKVVPAQNFIVQPPQVKNCHCVSKPTPRQSTIALWTLLPF